MSYIMNVDLPQHKNCILYNTHQRNEFKIVMLLIPHSCMSFLEDGINYAMSCKNKFFIK